MLYHAIPSNNEFFGFIMALHWIYNGPASKTMKEPGRWQHHRCRCPRTVQFWASPVDAAAYNAQLEATSLRRGNCADGWHSRADLKAGGFLIIPHFGALLAALFVGETWFLSFLSFFYLYWFQSCLFTLPEIQFHHLWVETWLLDTPWIGSKLGWCLQRKYQETCCTAKPLRRTRKMAWTFAEHWGSNRHLKVMSGRVRWDVSGWAKLMGWDLTNWGCLL